MMSDWQTEIRFASGWWAERILDAAKKAWPEGTLFAALSAELTKPSNMEYFREGLEVLIDHDFRQRKVAWNRSIPLEGSMMRRVGVEGAFISEPIRKACKAANLEEVLPFIPSGCVSIINPGKVFTAVDRRSPEKTYVIPPSPEPEHLRGLHGHGI